MTRAKDSLPYSSSADSTSSTCPFLGFLDDPEVHYSYPEAGNYCHRVKPPQTLNHQQQSEMCLAGKYRDCPVFSTGWNGPLPKELAGQPIYDGRQASFSKGWLFLIVGVVMLAIIGFSANYFWPAKPVTTLPAASQLTSLPAFVPSQTPQMEPTFAVILPLRPASLPTQTSLPPTQTPLPASSPTLALPTPGPLQETPFGSGGRYLVHVVQPGEVMETIAARYHTSVAVLLAVNRSNHWPLLWGGWPAVIVVGETDPSNIIPLQAIWLDQRTPLADLALEFAASPAELRALNTLGTDDWVEGQRWIIIPKS